MGKKTCFLICAVLVFGLAGSAQALVAVWLGESPDANGNYQWTDPANWSVESPIYTLDYVIPGQNHMADLGNIDPNFPTIDYTYSPPYAPNGLWAHCYRLKLGEDLDGSATLTMKRGYFETLYYLRMGNDPCGAHGIFFSNVG